MTDLNYPIEGKSAGELARYFDVDIELVKYAINDGAKTYREVYDYILSASGRVDLVKQAITEGAKTYQEIYNHVRKARENK